MMQRYYVRYGDGGWGVLGLILIQNHHPPLKGVNKPPDSYIFSAKENLQNLCFLLYLRRLNVRTCIKVYDNLSC